MNDAIGAVSVNVIGTDSGVHDLRDTKPKSEERRTVRVRIDNIGPEGAGLSASSNFELANVGGLVTFHLSISRVQLEIPGRLIWVKRLPLVANVGLWFRLELASEGHRKCYAEWIVTRLRKLKQKTVR